MNGRRSLSLRLALLAAVLVLGGLAELVTEVPSAQAQVPPLNVAVGLGTMFGADARRRGTYIAADQNQREFNQYYDSLRDTARSQFVSGELRSLRNTPSGLRSVRVGAFVKLDAALGAEQSAVTRAIEAEKNEARRNFNRTLVRTFTNVVLSTPGAQALLGQLRTVISSLRTSVVAIQAAVAAGRPFETIREQLANQVQESTRVQDAVRNLGTLIGQDLDQAMGGTLSRIDQAMAQAQQEMEAAATSLNNLDAQVAALSTARPNVLTSDRTGLPFNIRITDRANALLDVASSAYAFFAGQQGSRGSTRDQMYQEIRSQNLQEHNVQLLNAAMSVRSVTCTGVGRGEYETAMGMLGRTPLTPPEPDDAVYMVCKQRDGQLVHAYIVGGGIEALATPGEGTPTAQVEIPVGTYVGTTTVPSFLVNDTVMRNEVRITVDEHGAVTGDLAIETSLTTVISSTCSDTYFYVASGSFGGHLFAPTGQVDLVLHIDGHNEWTAGCKYVTSRPGETDLDMVAHMEVTGERMSGVVRGGQNMSGEPIEFSFEVSKE
ncbi:MAG: hypothetical protein FJZ97_00150 [Chloroflexi bacterium]|nr:hypothetical protein [Chloroflexota bacterium]